MKKLAWLLVLVAAVFFISAPNGGNSPHGAWWQVRDDHQKLLAGYAAAGRSNTFITASTEAEKEPEKAVRESKVDRCFEQVFGTDHNTMPSRALAVLIADPAALDIYSRMSLNWEDQVADFGGYRWKVSSDQVASDIKASLDEFVALMNFFKSIPTSTALHDLGDSDVEIWMTTVSYGAVGDLYKSLDRFMFQPLEYVDLRIRDGNKTFRLDKKQSGLISGGSNTLVFERVPTSIAGWFLHWIPMWKQTLTFQFGSSSESPIVKPTTGPVLVSVPTE